MQEQLHHDEFYTTCAEKILYAPLFRRLRQRIAVDFERRAGLEPNSAVLSLGCGEGQMERLLAPRVKRIVGFDISPVAIERARQLSAQAGLSNLSFEVADITEVHLSGRFDAISAFSLLHHLDDQTILRVLTSSRSLLKPSGVFYTYDPNVHRVVRFFVSLAHSTYREYHSPEERDLDPVELQRLFREAGYSAISIAYCDYFLGPLAWLMPNLPAWCVPPLSAIDWTLRHLPLIRNFSSAFTINAQR